MKISQKKGAAESEGCCGLILLIWSDQNSHSHKSPADHGVAKQREGPEVTVNGDRVCFSVMTNPCS